MVRGILRRRCGWLPSGEEMDIAQEVFMKVWDMLCKGAPIEEPRSYIATIAIRRAIDEARRRKRRPGVSLVNDDVPQDPSADARRLIAEIEEALRAFPEPRKVKVWWDRHVEGMEVLDVTSVHGIARETVKRWAKEVEEFLHKRFDIEDEGERGEGGDE